MADCDCEWCGHDEECPYAWENSDCYIGTIESARYIVNDVFESVYSSINEKSEDLCDNRVDQLVECMRTIIYDSSQPIPDWYMTEGEDE